VKEAVKYNPHAIKGRWIIQADAVAQQNKKNKKTVEDVSSSSLK